MKNIVFQVVRMLVNQLNILPFLKTEMADTVTGKSADLTNSDRPPGGLPTKRHR